MLYTGTFEAYQGLDLLFDAARTWSAPDPTCGFFSPVAVLISSRSARASWRGSGLDATSSSRANGRPPRSRHFLDAADVLVSPRSRGTNTPLKIYQYLRSGRPIVATRLLTHTQVLTDDIAILTERDARGVRRRHPAGDCGSRAAPARLVHAPAELAATKYSYDAYLAPDREAVGRLRLAAAPRRSAERGVSAEP